MTRYMVDRLGSIQRGAIDERRTNWRHMIAANYS